MKQTGMENKRIDLTLTLLIFALLVLEPARANAQETSGGFQGGSVQIGADTRACDSTLAGSIRYNSGTLCAEYCDGASWTCPASSSGAPTNCLVIGNVCSDGSIYAGLTPDGNVKMYTMSADVHYQVGVGSQLAGTGNSSNTAGETNTATLVTAENLATNETVEAGEWCYFSGDNGHDDWYLPARDELTVLYTNRVAIGNFTTGWYWSSTESTINAMRGCAKDFSTGSNNCDAQAEEYYEHNFRCVRK